MRVLETGNAYSNDGDVLRAIDCCGSALRLDPDSGDAWNNLGNLFLRLNDARGAVSCYQNSVRLQPFEAAAHYGLGRSLNLIGRHELALEHLSTASKLNPRHADTLVNLGNAHHYLGHFEEALRCFDSALPLSHRPAEVHVNRAMVLLNGGNFRDGWREFEYRWETPSFRAYKKRPFRNSQWRGEPLRGKRILLHGEQGLGDAIQFSRFIPEVFARGAEIFLEVKAPLKELMTSLIEPDHIIVLGEPVPKCDYQCSLISLPYLLGVELGDIQSSPYLKVNEFARAAARCAIERVADGHSQLKVGIAWKGNPEHSSDQLRSVIPHQLADLARTKGVQWYVLQKDATPEELAGLLPGLSVTTLPTEHLDGLLATAAVIQELDLVISVDTVTAHLTGALGKPLWLLLPAFYEWRWHSHLEDSPWYASARLFRQHEPGNWVHSIARMASELSLAVAKRREVCQQEKGSCLGIHLAGAVDERGPKTCCDFPQSHQLKTEFTSESPFHTELG